MAHDDIPHALPARENLPVARRALRDETAFAPSGFSSFLGWVLRLVLVLSLILNVVLLFMYLPGSNGGNRLSERFHSGDASSANRIAIVRVDGMIAEVLMGYATQQIQDAAQDDRVKAVVLLVNSPGGSVTASDQLWKQVKDLREGKWDRQSFRKPVVVSMESVAASGGYYIAAPADKIYAQPTTITGSIGVYASFLDLHVLAQKYGVDMNIIKRGELKGGSMLHEMTPEQRREWEELLEHSYQRFMAIVKEGRDSHPGGPRLKHGLRDELKLTTKSGEPFIRRLADGGIYTADQAKAFGLIDQIGYLDDAIKEAKSLAGVSEARVITYNRPLSLVDAILGSSSRQPDALINLHDIPGATARAWYLAPGHELSGVKLPGRLLRGE